MITKKKIKINILLIILLTVAIPIILGQFLNTYFPIRLPNIPIHSVIEAVGGVIAIVISMIFYVKYNKNHVVTHFNYATTALLTMGIIDIFHASFIPGNMFVWLHTTAVLFGGIFFMSVWFKKILVSKKVYRAIPVLFIFFALLFSLLSIYFSDSLPAMLNPDKSFTISANILNILGGIGFFAASLRFILNYIKTYDADEILFAGHTMLFGVASILFVSSAIWDLQWWLWHILRLFAYIIAFYYLYIEYRKEINIVEISNDKLENASKKMNEYLSIVDKNVITSTTNLDGNITDVSQAFCNISGYSRDELIGKPHNIVRHQDMPNEIYNELWETIKSGQKWHGEIKNRKKDGQEYWVDISVTPQFDEDGSLVCYTAIKHDITHKKKVEVLSITDDLTKLYNKRYFNESFEKEILRAKRDRKYISFLIMDIDYFKLYNDTYGHQKGDNALQEIGDILMKNTKRGSDLAFRLGGEEFGIIFSDLNNEDSLSYSQKIKDEIEALEIEHSKSNISKYITASFGLITQKGDSIQSVKEIYLLADKMLYKAKKNGRNRVCAI